MDSREYRQQYYQKNKVRLDAEHKAWRLANPDRWNAIVKRTRAKGGIYEKRKQARLSLKNELLAGRTCLRCGCVPEHPCILDFDRLDADTKAGKVSTFLTGNIQKAYEEAAKCQILCANCLRLKTYAPDIFYLQGWQLRSSKAGAA